MCVNSKQEVIDIVNKALENGGTIYGLPQDYDTLYAHDIKDPDGNILEFIYSK